MQHLKTINMKRSFIALPVFRGIALATTILLSGCATDLEQSSVQTSKINQISHKPILYVVIVRDRRLPAPFSSIFMATVRKELPNFEVLMDEGVTNDHSLNKADWVMSVRATRITPRFDFKPTSNSAVNGTVDCMLGSGFGAFLALAPCKFSGDLDYFEATLQNHQATTRSVFKIEGEESGFMSTPPLIYIRRLNEEDRWRDMSEELFAKIREDNSFTNTKVGP